MIIAIGSTRAPKVQAVETVFRQLAPELELEPEALEFRSLSASSGVSEMPMSLQALMTGARNRAMHAQQLLREAGREPAFAVGLEGGLFSVSPETSHSDYFLQSWVYVFGRGRGYFGCSAAVPVPAPIVRAVLEHRAELGVIIDEYANQKNVRDKGGAFEVFTRGRVVRQASYEIALICALAPFYNAGLYLNHQDDAMEHD
ncbi:MAG: inosine/xanthosine triphosphatase [candidate division KSB1 bacterium]|nr:inosine/xanthosine triphosphatase [candidate division KSB1 bacterium]MDQ7064520.1 inosine/xanthosine triphosphatase [candidate division KSB1 bacterium]